MSPMTLPQSVQLGPNGPQIPAIGLGTWAWGDSLFWGYGKNYGESDLQAAFTASLEAGVNLFDTAEIYGFGESEKLLGRFNRATNSPVLFATKYFPLPWRFNGAAVADALTASLKRLQVPQIELYQVHWPFDFFMGQETLMNALADEVEQGRIKAVGVSNYSAAQMRKAYSLLSARGIPLAANQVQYSLLNRQIESNGVLDTARELDLVIFAYSPLAQGLLTGKYGLASDQKPVGARQLDPRFSRDGLAKIESLVTDLRDIGAECDRTPAQVALNWLICQGNVVAIPGAKNAKQASQNAKALGWAMGETHLARLDAASRNWR